MNSNQDKENYKVTTKIPLPVPPLPGLPPHLLKKRADRPVLNTLAGSNNGFQNNNLAGPSTDQKFSRTRRNSPFKIDTRFVTIHRGCEDSGYFKAYKDDRRTSEPNVINISSDDDCDVQEREADLCEKEEFSDRRASTSTPAHHMLQPARVRNIKRSLKRPHSKELLGISPKATQYVPNEDRVKRRLSFNPTLGEKSGATRPHDFLTDRLVREYSGDIFSYLLQTEVKPAPPKVKNETRACVINWLMKINDGNPATIQIAIWYLDKILSSSGVSLENMQLVAAASFWIASKIEGPAVSASRLVRYSNNAFNTLRLLEAERVILMKLKFPSLTVVPQDFLCYLAWWCNKERPWEVSMAASFICLCGMMVNRKLCHEYPSVIAAAAIRCALLLLRKKELMPRLQKCSVFLAAENKAESISSTCVILRHAVRTVASQKYPYNYILKLYGTPPAYIAQTIVSAVNELSVLDTRSAAVHF